MWNRKRKKHHPVALLRDLAMDWLWLMGDVLREAPARPLTPQKQTTSERIAATQNDYLVGNVVFAIRKRTFAASGLNG